VAAHDLHIDRIATVVVELLDTGQLVTDPRPVRVAPAAIQKTFRVAGTADINILATVPHEPLWVLRVDDDLPRQRHCRKLVFDGLQRVARCRAKAQNRNRQKYHSLLHDFQYDRQSTLMFSSSNYCYIHLFVGQSSERLYTIFPVCAGMATEATARFWSGS
jgi:hypothetical protein